MKSLGWLSAFGLLVVAALPVMGGKWTNWEWIEPSPQGYWLTAVASNDDTVVAVGHNGATVVSTDGLHWDVLTPIGLSDLYDVVWNGEVFIAVGDRTILTSADGFAWTRCPVQIQTSLRSIIWTGTETIAFGWGGISYRSADLEVWEENRPDDWNELLIGDVAWNGDFFVAVGSNSFHNGFSALYIGDDGREWQLIPLSGIRDFWYESITWGNDRWVVVGTPKNYGSKIMVSEDGREWTPVAFGDRHVGLWDVAFFDGRFAATGYPGVFVRSENGIDWTTHDTGSQSSGLGSGSFKDAVIVVGPDGLITTSHDEVDWHQVNQAAFAVCEGGIKSIAQSDNGNLVAVSPGCMGLSEDGTDWVVSETQEYWNRVRWAEEAFWVLGYGIRLNGQVSTSQDGEHWEVVLPESDQYLTRYTDVAVNSSTTIAVGSNSADSQRPMIATKRQGEEWLFQSFPDRGHEFASVIWSGTRFLAASRLLDGILLESSDGLTWTSRDIGMPTRIRWFASNGSRTVGIGETMTPNGRVRSIVTSSSGEIWELADVPADLEFLIDVTWAGNRFVATAGGGQLLTSGDGITWTLGTNPFGYHGYVAGDESTVLTCAGTHVFRATSTTVPRGEEPVPFESIDRK